MYILGIQELSCQGSSRSTLDSRSGLSEVPEQFFFRLLFWLCGCLELLNRKARAIREKMKEDLGQCFMQDILT